MANDVKPTYTINNATIFLAVTDAAVGSVDLSRSSDARFYKQRRQ